MRKKHLCKVIATAALSTLCAVSPLAANSVPVFFAASPDQLIEDDSLWVEAGSRYGIDPLLLVSVAITESRRVFGTDISSPWPWTVRSASGARRFETKAAAVAFTESLIAAGEPLWTIDVGLTQLNLKWTWKKRGYSTYYTIGDLFSPEINTGIAAAIIAELTRDELSASAIGRYNTSNEPKRSRYGAQVMNTYMRLKAQYAQR